MLKYLPLVLLLAACGADDDHPTEKAAEAEAHADKAREAQTEEPTSTSYLYATASELPTCDESTKSWLAYIASEKSFVACDGEAWQTVDVKGKAGVSGKDGKDGEAGKDGKDSVAAEPALLEGQWRDPVTDRVWLLAGLADFDGAGAACQDDYAVPTLAELEAGSQHGLFRYLEGSEDFAWTSSMDDDGLPANYAFIVGATATDFVIKTNVYDVYCLKVAL